MSAPTEDLIARLEAPIVLHGVKDYPDEAMAVVLTHCQEREMEAAQALRALQQEVERLNRLVGLWVPKTYCPTGNIGSSVKEYRALIKSVNAATDADIARSALTGSTQG